MNEPAGDVYDVAIVGLGPVGAAAANLLGQRGIRCFACDRATDIFPLPRALGFDHEPVRELGQLAAADLGLAAPPPQDVTELRC